MNKAAAWLSEQGCETEADKAELAAVHLMAAVALLERPIRRSCRLNAGKPRMATEQLHGQRPPVLVLFYCAVYT